MTTLHPIALEFPAIPGIESVLTAEALAFLADLHRRFDARRLELLAARAALAARLDAGETLDFPSETADRRAAPWHVAPAPADLQDRRVEITGPCERKMVINALNSGAKVFMACLEDATAPTAFNVIDGQINLRDAVAGDIAHVDEASGKHYALGSTRATLKLRPRGWHLEEKHMLVDGRPIAGALFDFGLYFFHNAKALIAKGSGPYFYLPKLEHYREARLWNEVFIAAQEALGIPQGTVRATVLIETLPAAFHAEDILYELKDHIDGLNCGRWDYIFSTIKKHRANPNAVLPDRAAVTMTVPFMRAYCLHVIKVCHRRGAHAIGGMAAQIPIKGDDAANEAAFAKVRADKEREARDGHDGTWVAHPGLVPVAREVFDRMMPGANQLARQRDDVTVTAADLLVVRPKRINPSVWEKWTTQLVNLWCDFSNRWEPSVGIAPLAPCAGPKTLAGLRMNVNVGIGYLAAWLGGRGAVPLHHLMEDAATAEISRAQLWQWRHNKTRLDSGEVVDEALINQAFDDELDALRASLGAQALRSGHYEDAAKLMREMVLARQLPEFLTTLAYDRFFAP
ncbi:MAG: malate synthase A [Pseudomonadota bacterium]